MLLKRAKNKLYYLYQIFKTNLFFKSKLFHLGKNCILEKKLSISNNLQNVHIGNNVRIRYGWRIETINPNYLKFPLVKIGNGTKIERFLHIGAVEGVEIGENVLIASNVFITDHNHQFNDTSMPILKQGVVSKGKVYIKENCWLGNNVTILPGVTIGRNAVIGSNSVVTKDIPQNCVAAGIPAKVLKCI
jgi:acetyltransferase-like isoleucine patch superfamily enzyme